MNTRASWIISLGWTLLAACAHTEQNLAPAAMARAAGHVPEAAIDEDQGVEVIAQARGWPPGKAPERELGLTPFKVWIHNGSARPLQIRLQSFALTAADGSDYRAVPVFPGGGHEVIANPAFEHTAFEVAPYLAARYPDLPAYDGPFSYESIYYTRYYDSEATAALAAAMRHVLPEGVLEPGGRLAGYVLFQSPTEADLSKGNVRFRVELSERSFEPAFARMSIPFADRQQ